MYLFDCKQSWKVSNILELDFTKNEDFSRNFQNFSKPLTTSVCRIIFVEGDIKANKIFSLKGERKIIQKGGEYILKFF